MKRLILLVNVGTPDSPAVQDVRKYLKQFLSDPKVLTIPAFFRWLLLRLVILPFRSPKSAHAYQQIWTDKGSPLLCFSQDLSKKVQYKHPKDLVTIGMRYGSPSIESAILQASKLGVNEIVAVPLFPQFSDAATGSAVAEVQRQVSRHLGSLPLKFSGDFYEHPKFISAQGHLIRAEMAHFSPDHILMSYHGLPESHVKATDLSGAHCLAQKNCCETLSAVNNKCYRAQSFATSRALARFLKIDASFYSVSFQSRLGRTPWIQPFTDKIIADLRQRGIKRLLVVCPSFVSDCLETLEEIGMRCKEDWLALGGEELRLVPCANSAEDMVDCISDLMNTANLA